MLDVDHVVAHLQVAEIGKKGGSLRLLALRTRDDRLRLIKQVTRAQDGEVGVREGDAIGHVGFGQRGGEQFAGEIGSFVGVTFSAAGPAAQAERNSVLAENVGQALDFSGIGDGDQHSLAVRDQLLYFLEHRWNRAMEAGCGLGME